ncbi:MAG TPA: membrane protein insertion efficiency factor YidD [Candidatus Dojkabacteria bacterium]|nr:membrane protein insertion efficiency factor YidD [Candidatus Dojkabacteria bacterium]
MIKRFLLCIIKGYQKTFSYDHGVAGIIFPNLRYCRFVPTCSEYGYEAIDKYGVIKGGFLAVRRVLRCNPWNKGDRYDPVP